MKKVILLNINWNYYAPFINTDTTRPPVCQPIEYAYLSWELKRYGWDAVLLDAYRMEWTIKETARYVKASKGDLLIVTTTPSLLYWRCPPLNLKYIKQVLKSIRMSHRIPSIAIGPHGVISPEWVLQSTDADYVFAGNSFSELAERIDQILKNRISDRIIKQKSSYDSPYFSKMDFEIFGRLPYGGHYWSEGMQDSFMSRYHSGMLLESSKGCPFTCSYCFKNPCRNHFFRKSGEQLEAELKYVSAHKIDYVFFIDEVFNMRDSSFEAILRLIKKYEISFGCQIRPDLLTENIIRKMSDAGCVYMECGVDCVDLSVGSQIGRNLNLEHSFRMISYAKKYIPVVRYNHLNFSTLDYLELLGGELKNDWKRPADPIYPYPNTFFGNGIMKRYGYECFSWKFARKYLLWLRMEVQLQRENINVRKIKKLKKAFLKLPEIVLEKIVIFMNRDVRVSEQACFAWRKR